MTPFPWTAVSAVALIGSVLAGLWMQSNIIALSATTQRANGCYALAQLHRGIEDHDKLTTADADDKSDAARQEHWYRASSDKGRRLAQCAASTRSISLINWFPVQQCVNDADDWDLQGTDPAKAALPSDEKTNIIC